MFGESEQVVLRELAVPWKTGWRRLRNDRGLSTMTWWLSVGGIGGRPAASLLKWAAGALQASLYIRSWDSWGSVDCTGEEP